MKRFTELREKAVSQQQQKLMGLALAYKRGEASDDEVSDEVKKIANSMSMKDLEDFAKTKHKGLPKKVDEYGGPPISRKDYLKQKPMKENVEDEMPASPDEKRMAMKQAEFIQYVGREIGEHLVANKEFPEWMQNKLSALHQKAKDMHATLGAHGGDMKEEVELDEDALDQLVKRYNDVGRVARRYPRKKIVSVDGRGMKEKDAIEKMKRVLKMEESVELDEGTWALPSNEADVSKLVKLLSKPLPASKASKVLYNLIGDDDLFDDIGSEKPNTDVRFHVIRRIKELVKNGKFTKPQSGSLLKKVLGSVKEEVELDEEQKLFMFKTKPEAQKKAKEIRGKVLELGPKNFAVVDKELTVVREEVELHENFIRSLRQVADKLGLRDIAWKLLDMEKDKAAEKIKQSDIDGFVKDAEEAYPLIKKNYQRYYKSLINKLKKAKGREALDMMQEIARYISKIQSTKKMRAEEVESGKSYWDLREKRNSAGSDARSAMRDDPDMKQKFSKDVSATDDDRKAADKNIIVQLRRVSDLPKGGTVEFMNGRKAQVSQKDAEKMLRGFDSLRKGPDKERFQKMAGKDPAGMKKVLGMIRR